MNGKASGSVPVKLKSVPTNVWTLPAKKANTKITPKVTPIRPIEGTEEGSNPKASLLAGFFFPLRESQGDVFDRPFLCLHS